MDNVGRGPVGIDTAVFIYYNEEHPVYSPGQQFTALEVYLGPVRRN